MGAETHLIPVVDALLEQCYHLRHIVELGLLQHTLLGDAVEHELAVPQIVEHGRKVFGIPVDQVGASLVLEKCKAIRISHCVSVSISLSPCRPIHPQLLEMCHS